MKDRMKSTKVYLLLEQRNSKFISQVNDAIDYANDVLPQIEFVFNTYTIHGMKHAINVSEYMYELIEDASKLSDLEIAVLIYAALFHDIGMCVSPMEVEKVKKDEILLNGRMYTKVLEKYGKETIALQECIRPVHGIRSAEHIELLFEEKKELFLIPETTSISFHKELALICQAHTEDFIWLINELQTNIVKGHYNLNAQFITILLRLADYLDIDEQRAPLHLYKFLKPEEFSDLEWRQHFSIENYKKIRLDEKTGLKEIVFQGQSEDPIVHRKLLKYFESINQELLKAVSRCEKYDDKIYLLNVKTHVVNQIHTSSFTFSDLRLELDYFAVTNLLMGENIYGNKKYGLREIIQNSIDACRTMQEEAENHPDFELQKYSPCIGVILNEDRKTVTIFDNGKGMSVDILKKYFLNVGKSYYRSDDYILQGKRYSPIGYYGIGFLACFMLSDKVEVSTRYIGDNNVTKIEFQKNSEYICMTCENKYRAQGTEIVLDYEQFMDVFENDIDKVVLFIEENFLECGIPIDISFWSGGRTIIKKCKMKKPQETLVNAICLDKYLDGIQVYIEGNFKKIEFPESLEELNGYSGYIYDSENKKLRQENDEGLNQYAVDGMLKFAMYPVIDSCCSDEFETAYEVLEDFEEALEKIDDYTMINILPTDPTELKYETEVEHPRDSVIGEFLYPDFCKMFEHPFGVPTYRFIEKIHIVSNMLDKKVLPYRTDVWIGNSFYNDRKEEIYLKGVLLQELRNKIPYLVNGIKLDKAIINIINKNFVPNVSRNSLSTELQSELSYAIGKAIHLWLLENMEFAKEEKELLKQFIIQKYPVDNICLKGYANKEK